MTATPQARFKELCKCAAEGLTVDQTAERMGCRASDIYPVKWVLGLQFRNASIGNRNGTGRSWTGRNKAPTDPTPPANMSLRPVERHYRGSWE